MKKNILLLCVVCNICYNLFAQPAYPVAPAPPGNLVKAEYFFNTDPGFGNGTTISLPASQNVNTFTSSITLNGTALANGFHRLYIRTLDASGKWSLTHENVFSKVLVPAYPAVPNPGGNIVKAEYYINTDPGFGNGTNIPVPQSADVAGFSALLNITGVAPGVHRLYVRTLDANGKWSLTHYAVFDNTAITPYPTAPAPASPVSHIEYYFDNDPGFGNGLPITVPLSTNVTEFSSDVPVGSLSPGRHTIYLRSRQNPWSLSAYADFLIATTLPVSWLYVKGEVKNHDAQLQWATGSEQNTAGFIIESSSNGSRFSPIGEVAATNNASGSTYRFLHKSPGSGTVYYRIKQVDKDGAFTYSKTIMLLFQHGLKEPVLFPVPATTILYIAVPAESSYEEIRIYDLKGQLIRTKQIVAAKAGEVVSLPVQELTKGVYFTELSGNGQKTTKQFIKK